MSDAHYVFQTSAFADTPASLADNVNGIAGASLAAWLGAELRRAGLQVSETWAEDHGWAFGVEAGGAKYLCACSLEPADAAGPAEAHVQVTKVRSIGDRLFGRNRLADSDVVLAAVQGTLASSPDVLRLTVERTA